MPATEHIDAREPEPNINRFLACPFCDSSDLRIVDWCDDEGEYYAIECGECKGCAPAEKWNTRHGVDHVHRH